MNWKQVQGFEGLYDVSSDGTVASLLTHGRGGSNKRSNPKILKPIISRRGYPRIGLHKNNKRYHYFIHRLVAENFIPNPDGLKTVNHINGVKTDNRIENLEWLSHVDNTQHAIRIGLVVREKLRIAQYTLDGLFVREFLSLRDVNNYGFFASSVWMVINGKRKKHHGFNFKKL